MARIRTIKPEFWTDEKIVGLPFQARLLFIGMWNFADDCGGLDYSPDRIAMQVFPGDPDVDVSGLLDLLEAAGLIEIWGNEEGQLAISIRNWSKHQKIDNPSKKTVIREGYRKRAIPSEARLAVAKKYGCPPGGEADAECFYCGLPGKVMWWLGARGRPTKWVTLSDLEFDHFQSEHSGGESTNENIVLACRSCNRGKREFSSLQFFVQRNIPGALASPSEDSPLEGKGSRNRNGKDHSTAAAPPCEPPEFAELKSIYPRRAGSEPWSLALKAANARLREGHTWVEILDGARRYARFIRATGAERTEHVLQAKTFCGPSKRFLEPFDLPATKADNRLAENLSAVDQAKDKLFGSEH